MRGGGKRPTIGLVLSGGGAKGAYQAGIVRALAELDVPIAAISGASVGALNGAVVASSGTLGRAAEKLAKLWNTIAKDPPLGGKLPLAVQLMEALGFRFSDDFRCTAKLANEAARNFLPTLRSPETGALFDNARIRRLVAEYVPARQLARGTPLYVSVYPRHGKTLDALIGPGLATLRLMGNRGSEFLHVQSLPPKEQLTALLASAAIPFLLEAQEIGGERYMDGGLGGILTSSGNTPIAPLLDAGCDLIIVTHLSDSSAWDGQKRPGAAFIEIKREEKISRTPVLPEFFDIIAFQPEKIRSWMEQGYGDTLRSVRQWARSIV